MSEQDRLARLSATELAADPMTQFARWFDEAGHAGQVDHTAMTLATVDVAGRPSARIVLLKEADARGFVFYSNYNSRKAVELRGNPHCSLVFWWDRMGRQVRVEGRAEHVPAAESDAYFASRPRESQIGAWASAQSTVVKGREVLDQAFVRLDALYGHTEVPRPPHWGGFLVVPECVEFWQNGIHRMHDRLRYMRQADDWYIERLSP